MKDACSPRQLHACLYAALLAPASALPAVLAAGGALAWLTPLFAFPLGVLVLRRVRGLGRDGLAAAWRGKRVVLGLYYLWAAGLAALTAGGCVDRLCRTDYTAAPRWLLSLALAATAAYLIRKGIAPFLRAGQIFFLALVAVTAVFFLLGAFHLRWENLAVGDVEACKDAWEGLLPAAGALSVATLGAFFPRAREPAAGPPWRWMAGWCVTAAGLCLLVLGALGPRLAASAPLPFSLALQGLGLPGGFQRLEALGTAAWVLSDLTLLGLAALAGREMAGGRPWAPWPILAAALLGGCLLPNAVTQGLTLWLTGVNLALGGVLPVLLSLGRRPAAPQPEGTSCG